MIPSLVSHTLPVVFQLTTHQELWTYIVTNLASVYIREGNRHQEVSLWGRKKHHDTVALLILLLTL